MPAELLRTVMESDVVAFARLSGDENPIHLSEALAAATPFGGRIADEPRHGTVVYQEMQDSLVQAGPANARDHA